MLTIESAREVMRRLQAVKDKAERLPGTLKEDIILECKLIEDRIRDKFYRRAK